MNQVNVVTNSLGQIVAVQEHTMSAAHPQSSYVPHADETVYTMDVPDDLKQMDLLELHHAAAVINGGGKPRLVKRAA